MGIERRMKAPKLEITEEEISLFEEAWKLYPRKIGKSIAQKWYAKLLKKHSHKDLIAAVKNLAEEKQDVDIQFIPQGDTFFSERCTDYLPENYTKKTTQPKMKKFETVTVYKYEFKGYGDYLKTLKTIPYKDYLQTEHWIHFKREAIKFFGHKCQLCNTNTKEIHIHHKTYENRGRETFNDVIPLCDECHRLVHNK